MMMVTKEGKHRHPIVVGGRICSEGDFGTVRYIGEIETQEGQWIGVEWDNTSRGKHSGTFKDISYFKTRIPNTGSFIRPWKARTGITCPEAVRKKYGSNIDDSKNEAAPANFALPQKSGKVRLIETVGFKKVAGKQSKFHELTHVVVSSMLVNGPGEPDEMRNLVPNVIILDLSCNLISSWADVAAIAAQLDDLRSLMLSKNRMRIEENMESLKPAFEELEVLALNRVYYDFSDVLRCSLAWPDVQRLFVCNNKLSILETPVYPALGNVKILSLEGNAIRSWAEINKLGGLKLLEELYLDDNRLENVLFEGVAPSEKTELFPNLVSLSLKNNRLGKWRDVSELNKLPNLHHLKLYYNPITESVSPETSREMIIAKIESLHILNKSEIDRSERKGAEIDYIKMYHREWMANGGQQDLNNYTPSPRFLEEHPTYISLLRKHGAAEEAECDAPAALLKNNLISVELFNTHAPYGPTIIKRLPVTMLVCKVKALVRRLYKIPVHSEIKMNCVRANVKGRGADMDNDLREIGYYCASDGDRIEISWQ